MHAPNLNIIDPARIEILRVFALLGIVGSVGIFGVEICFVLVLGSAAALREREKREKEIRKTDQREQARRFERVARRGLDVLVGGL